jgi:hypothetical protein
MMDTLRLDLLHNFSSIELGQLLLNVEE